jgi:chromosome segregation ATPase
MSGSLERVENKLVEQSNDIKALTQSISDLTVVMARKEERDHHMNEDLKEIKKDLSDTKKKVSALEIVCAGDDAMRKIFWRVTFTVISILVGAIVYLVVSK